VLDIDIAIRHGNALEAGRKLKQNKPAVELTFMTMNHDSHLIREAFRAVALAFVLKHAAVIELTDATKQVSNGGKHDTPRAAEALPNRSGRQLEGRD
jgi:DNA-binding NarL/FixJ family response regulator